MIFMQNMMKQLVAYFSWSGNTRKIARQINSLVDAYIHEIQPVNDYPANYNDVLYIGYTNWWNTFPAPVLTFLSENDFSGKTIIPFCTHGGGGSGRNFFDIAKICQGSVVREGFSINGYAVRDSNSKLEEFINHIKLN